MRIKKSKWMNERPENIKALKNAKNGLILSAIVAAFGVKGFLKSFKKKTDLEARIDQVDYMFDKFEKEGE